MVKDSQDSSGEEKKKVVANPNFFVLSGLQQNIQGQNIQGSMTLYWAQCDYPGCHAESTRVITKPIRGVGWHSFSCDQHLDRMRETWNQIES